MKQNKDIFIRRLDEIRMAIMLLTRLPAGRIDTKIPSIPDTVWAWPLIGMLIGIISSMAFFAGNLFALPPVITAILVVSVGILFTGGLHEDGLADVADGFGGGQTVQKKLDIMRDSRVGSYGVIILILAIGMRVSAISYLPNTFFSVLGLIGIAAVSRSSMSLVSAFLPPARDNGLGHTAKDISKKMLSVSLLLSFIILLPLGIGLALQMLLGMAIASTLVGWLALKQINGQTGDVLGATQQICEITCWILMLVYLG